jgi:RNA polymerase sigma-70 factor (ECF subfamily)
MSSSPARYFPGILARHSGRGDQDFKPVDDFATDARVTEIADRVSDEVLMLRLKGKDVDALGLLYRRYARLVYSICFRILRDSAEAQDLVQEVFLCLFRKCKSFDSTKGAARSWLLQLAYSKCFDWRDYLRTRHGCQHGRAELHSSFSDVSSSKVSWDPAYVVLWNPRMVAAFKSLSKEQQLALTLYYFQGYTFQEIADRLGYSYGNVKHHIYRGIGRLREIVFDDVERPTSLGAGQGMTCEKKEMAG